MAEFGVIPRASRVAGKGEESQRMRKRQRKRLPQQESDFPCFTLRARSKGQRAEEISAIAILRPNTRELKGPTTENRCLAGDLPG